MDVVPQPFKSGKAVHGNELHLLLRVAILGLPGENRERCSEFNEQEHDGTSKHINRGGARGCV